jgi:predicted metalloprotease
MFKTLILIIVVIAGTAYYNDPHSLDSWGQTANDVGKVTAKVVKSTGDELHKAARADDTVAETISNTVEDVKEIVNK